MTSNTLAEDGQDWEEQANNWIAWVRKPNFDSFWRYKAEFFEFAPAPGKSTLDFGCGEGRVSRELVALGHTVTGFDASPTMVAAARAADPTGDYLVADAVELPFPDGRFDVVLAYNVLMDVPDLPGSIREAARVLAPGGRLCLSITHPITNTGRQDANGHFVHDQPYFETRRFRDEVERDGLRMVFTGWEHPLTAFTRPLEDNGLLIEAIREPRAVSADGRVADVPYHFWLRAVKPQR